MFSTQAEPDFTRNFMISLGAHALLVLVAYFGGSAIMKVLNVNNDIEIIRSSVRVDVVGMPKFTVQELREMQAESKPVAEPAPVEKPKEEIKATEVAEDVIKKDDLVIQEKGETKKKPSFMNIVSNYSSKKVEAKEKREVNKTGKGTNYDSLVLEGNRLSKGGALVGDYSDAEQSEFAAYVQTLPDSIRPHWKLPDFLMGKGYKCRMRVFISPNGYVLKVETVESSGNDDYDARAVNAIKSVVNFPTPPAQVGQRLTKFGIILGFPL